MALFPEYLELKRHKRMLLAVTETNPYFKVDQGDDTPTQSTPGLAHIDGRALTNFCAYDYIGMAHDPAVTAATKDAIDRYGTGAGASRLVSGEKQIHRDLEHALAAFLGTPAAIVFVSGHATNVTTIGHLMGPGDLIVHDILAHNSILQGARLSGATCRGFAHNDWRALDVLLSGIRHSYRRVLIAIEGVYSMDGDYPDLARFVDIKEKASRDALCRRGPFARNDGQDRPRPRRTRRRRPLQRRPVDGHAVQIAGELRRLHRGLRRTHRVPQVHGARVRLQRGNFPAQRGHGAGRPDGPAPRAAARRTAPRRCRDSSCDSRASADSIRGSPREPR